MNDKINITQQEFAIIRSLEDFDLTMFLSELNDYGWQQARRLLVDIAAAVEAERKRNISQ